MKPATAEKSPDTSAKSSAKNPSKVFDVARPGRGKPNATSRPIIVNNRPILQDPMVRETVRETVKEGREVKDGTDASAPTGGEKPSEQSLSPAAVKVTIKPLSLPSELGNQDESDESGEAEKSKDSSMNSIADLANESKTGDNLSATAEAPVDASTGSDDKTETAPPLAETTESTSSTPTEDTALAVSDGTNDAIDSTDALDATDPINSTDSPDSKDSLDSKETAAIEAEVKKQEAIDALVESRQYALPINAVERHRSKVVAVLGLMLILALGTLLLDLLLDVGFVRLGGVHSLTHFFSF